MTRGSTRARTAVKPSCMPGRGSRLSPAIQDELRPRVFRRTFPIMPAANVAMLRRSGFPRPPSISGSADRSGNDQGPVASGPYAFAPNETPASSATRPRHSAHPPSYFVRAEPSGPVGTGGRPSSAAGFSFDKGRATQCPPSMQQLFRAQTLLARTAATRRVPDLYYYLSTMVRSDTRPACRGKSLRFTSGNVTRFPSPSTRSSLLSSSMCG